MSDDWFSVYLEASAPDAEQGVVPAGRAVDDWLGLLAEHDGVVSAGAGAWAATVSVRAADAAAAVSAGLAVVTRLAGQAGMPPWPTVQIDVVRHDVLAARPQHPALPELVSAPEAARILGVSKQRFHHLAASHAAFPEPACELRAGKMWMKAAIKAFDESWDRRPGRPRAAAPGAAGAG